MQRAQDPEASHPLIPRTNTKNTHPRYTKPPGGITEHQRRNKDCLLQLLRLVQQPSTSLSSTSIYALVVARYCGEESVEDL